VRLSIGCGALRLPGFVGVDKYPSPAVDVVHDLTVFPWPFSGDSVDEVRAWHVLEHMPGYSFPAAVDEIHRILRPGGVLYVKVPYKEDWAGNPYHVRGFNRRTFNWWVIDHQSAKEMCLQAARCRFYRRRQDVVEVVTGFPWGTLRDVTPGLIDRFPVLFPRDERDYWSRIPPLMGRQRELREWLVKV